MSFELFSFWNFFLFFIFLKEGLKTLDTKKIIIKFTFHYKQYTDTWYERRWCI